MKINLYQVKNKANRQIYRQNSSCDGNMTRTSIRHWGPSYFLLALEKKCLNYALIQYRCTKIYVYKKIELSALFSLETAHTSRAEINSSENISYSFQTGLCVHHAFLDQTQSNRPIGRALLVFTRMRGSKFFSLEAFFNGGLEVLQCLVYVKTNLLKIHPADFTVLLLRKPHKFSTENTILWTNL